MLSWCSKSRQCIVAVVSVVTGKHSQLLDDIGDIVSVVRVVTVVM